MQSKMPGPALAEAQLPGIQRPDIQVYGLKAWSMENGAFAYITKPVNFEQLEEKLQEAMRVPNQKLS